MEIPKDSKTEKVLAFFSRSSAKIAPSIRKVQEVLEKITLFFSEGFLLFNPAQIGKFKLISGIGILSSLYLIPAHIYQNIKGNFYDTATGHLHVGEDFYGLTVNTANFMEGCVLFGVKATKPLLEAIASFYALSTIFSIASIALNLKSFTKLPRKTPIDSLRKLNPDRIKVTLDISSKSACKIHNILKTSNPKAENRIKTFVARKALTHAILATASITHIIGVFVLLATPIGSGVVFAVAITFFITSITFLIERHCFEKKILSLNDRQTEIELQPIVAHNR